MVIGKAERLSTLEVVKISTAVRATAGLAPGSRSSQADLSPRHPRKQFLELKQEFQQGEVPLPSFWAGRVSISRWSSGRGQHRLHDRFLYQRDSGTLENRPSGAVNAEISYRSAGAERAGALLYDFSHLAKSRVPAEVQSFIHGEFDGKQ